MTNPIAIGLNITGPANPAIALGKTDAKGASGFAILLDGITAGKASQANIINLAPGATAPRLEHLDLEALSQALGEVLELLDGIEQGLADDQPVDPAALEALPGLIDTINDLLDAGAVIDPESPLLGLLQNLAQTLGIETAGEGGSPLSGLEALSALATRIGAELREMAPHLSSALSEMSRRLDNNIAAIQSALANAEPDAATMLKLVESETKPNAHAAIAQAGAAEPEKSLAEPGQPVDKTAQPGESTRSLTAAGDEKQGQPGSAPAPSGTLANSASALAAAAGANTAAAAETQTDAPDGLTIGAGQNSTPTTAHGAVRPEAAAYTRPEPRINVPHIAVEIARSIQNGISRFEIRLNPPELGRVDVRLEMDQSGNVIARLAVEKSETLDLLQRDQRALERALADAGLDGSKTELEFSLRQDNGRDDQPAEGNKWNSTVLAGSDTTEPHTLTLPDGAMRGYARLDAVNLWV